jgi:CheY-like chemotaxis protein
MIFMIAAILHMFGKIYTPRANPLNPPNRAGVVPAGSRFPSAVGGNDGHLEKREAPHVCSQAKGLAGAAVPVVTRPSAVTPSAATLKPCRILLVEDHADTAEMMQRLLARRGYVVTVATTVAEARSAAQTQTFDLLLCDIGLPDGSGLDLMRELSRTARLPGIALSGYGMPDDTDKSLDAGFLEHLTKPVAVDRLWATIDRVLASCASPVDV